MSDIDDVLGRNDPDILARHKNISAKDARNNFSEIMNATKFGKERFVITHRGKPTMALVTISDLRLLDEIAKHGEQYLQSYEHVLDPDRDGLAEDQAHEQRDSARISQA